MIDTNLTQKKMKKKNYELTDHMFLSRWYKSNIKDIMNQFFRNIGLN